MSSTVFPPAAAPDHATAPVGALRADFAAAWSALADAPACEHEIVAATGSTNADLLARARRSAPAVPWLRAADVQHAGRGRQGRSWQAAPGAALLFSIAVPQPAAAALAPLTLACGVALAELLRAHAVPVQLKWPNDLLLDGAKLAGILAELALDGSGRRTVVVGVGLNLALDAAARAAIGQPAAALEQALPGAAAARGYWLAQCAAALLRACATHAATGFAPLRPRYEAVLAWQGATVELHDAGGRVATGRLVGVDDDGRLRLDTADGPRLLLSGELSLRPQPTA